MLRPMPPKFGVGFTIPDSDFDDLNAELVQRHVEWKKNYRHEKVGNHHNYHATAQCWKWPDKIVFPKKNFVIDGFSPNLNKSLHVGHLRNLAIANSLMKILSNGRPEEGCNTKFVAMLGASLGVKEFALNDWRYWTNFLGYKPEEYFDITLPDDTIPSLTPVGGESGVLKPTIWSGPLGDVIVRRSDGSSLYALHDLLFSAYVGPTHYITGHEQKEHFASLGFADKHLPMGLVLGEDNKKLKSRTGDAMPAFDVIQMLRNRLEGEYETTTKLAWNILAWNFLHTTREKNLKFEVESWTRPDQGGLYISYTYARVLSALRKKHQPLTKLYQEAIEGGVHHRRTLYGDLQDIDVSLLAFSEQYNFYFQESLNRLDSAPIANFAFDLAKMIGHAYETEKISGGRREFSQSIEHATWRLQMCMSDLGMFRLQEV